MLGNFCFCILHFSLTSSFTPLDSLLLLLPTVPEMPQTYTIILGEITLSGQYIKLYQLFPAGKAAGWSMWLALHCAHWVVDTCASRFFRKNLSKLLKIWNKKKSLKLAKQKLIQKTERFSNTLEYFDFWMQTKKYVEQAILSKSIKAVFLFCTEEH